ncbi:hypothetical protein GCM10025859_23210 [Alicyclobacillus fastidiosus]|nr:hypothetical protein GCM10025859_23210 [Alicyclobacillus fastidiosus]
MGVFGGYTRWAVVFLIIFVLFFLLCPVTGYVGAPVATGYAMTHYDYNYDATTTTAYGVEGTAYPSYHYSAYDYTESESSM